MGHNGSPYNDVSHVALIAHDRTLLITSFQPPLDLNDPQELFFPAMTGILLWKEVHKLYKQKNMELSYSLSGNYTMVTIVPATCHFLILGEKLMD